MTVTGKLHVVQESTNRATFQDAQAFSAILEMFWPDNRFEVRFKRDPRAAGIRVKARASDFPRVWERLVLGNNAFTQSGPTPDRGPHADCQDEHRVLVAAENPGICELLCQFVKLMGHGYDRAAGADRITKLVENREYDLLLLGGTHFGGTSTFHLLQHLRPYLEFTTPTVVLTGSHLGEVWERMSAVRSLYFVLPKPVEYAALKRVANEALEYRHLFQIRQRARAGELDRAYALLTENARLRHQLGTNAQTAPPASSPDQPAQAP